MGTSAAQRRLGRSLATLVCGVALACTYDAPPDAILVAAADNRFVEGEPIVVRFSEPVRPESVEVSIWPGQKDLYDGEGRRAAEVEPLLPACALASSPCGGDEGVALALDETRTELSLRLLAARALGPRAQPLVLEVSGTLCDDGGHRKDVTQAFHFQIVEERWDPYADAVSGGPDAGAADADADGAVPVEVPEVPLLFFAEFERPIPLPQQFFVDPAIDAATGAFVLLMTDADPVDGAERNTCDPAELHMDTGVEGFIFTARGRIAPDDEGLRFDAEPFTLALQIGPIVFELRDVVLRGRIRADEVTGAQRWDGTMAVREVFYQVGDNEQIYPSDQANFQAVELRPEETPAGMPRVCDEDPCSRVGGSCDLLPDTPWPPATVCPGG